MFIFAYPNKDRHNTIDIRVEDIKASNVASFYARLSNYWGIT